MEAKPGAIGRYRRKRTFKNSFLASDRNTIAKFSQEVKRNFLIFRNFFELFLRGLVFYPILGINKDKISGNGREPSPFKCFRSEESVHYGKTVLFV